MDCIDFYRAMDRPPFVIFLEDDLDDLDVIYLTTDGQWTEHECLAACFSTESDANSFAEKHNPDGEKVDVMTFGSLEEFEEWLGFDLL
jgi:hypothetical protein